jgi:hypothetical protein
VIIPNAAPPQELNLSAFKDNFCFSFFLDNFGSLRQTRPWLGMSAEGKLGRLPLEACHALSKLSFGTFYHQRGIEVEGAIDYSKSLKSLIPDLTATKKESMAGMIVPIVLLLIYSVGSASGC